MRTSRLAGFIIDCQVTDLQQAAAFWGAALNMDLQPLPGEEGVLPPSADPGKAGDAGAPRGGS